MGLSGVNSRVHNLVLWGRAL
uniref:Uncharacterized protein n=1 Tax=Anguilla anguilla TaxID=7936 RepID=A0A0E9XWS7_ANGAN